MKSRPFVRAGIASVTTVLFLAGLCGGAQLCALAQYRHGGRFHHEHVFIAPPPYVYIEAPIYVGGVYHPYRVGNDHNADRRSEENRWKDDPELKQTVYDLEDAFQNDDIKLLTPLTDPKVKIAIFSKGHYEYSLDASDYLDATKDFMRTGRTSDFNVYRVRRRSAGVWQLFAKHAYKTDSGDSKTVYLCVVVEQVGGRWTITQVDTAPDHLDK